MCTSHPDVPSASLNSGWTYYDRVQPDAHGQTVLDFYAQRYPHSSRATWRERIETGAVRLDGRPTTPEAVLFPGRRLSYHRPPWREPDVPCTFALLYEDPHVLAVAKPSGLPVLPGGHCLENTLLALVRRRYGGAPPPAPIHRLGRGTSGIVLFARTALAKRALSEDLSERRFVKIYRALAGGVTMPDEFTVETPIGRIPYPQIGALYAAAPHGKPARTECRVLCRDREKDRSLLHVRIHTGRPHQIRIHLAAAGFPLAGDPLYGIGGRPAPRPGGGRLPLPGDCGYHLHAHRVRFTHPETGRTVAVTCTPPPILRTPEERIS